MKSQVKCVQNTPERENKTEILAPGNDPAQDITVIGIWRFYFSFLGDMIWQVCGFTKDKQALKRSLRRGGHAHLSQQEV